MSPSFSFGRSLPFAVGLLLALAACDSDGDDSDQTIFERFDQDGSGDISVNEFGAWFVGRQAFRNFADSDEDGELNQDEFRAGLYGVFDADDDDMIDEDEFVAGNAFFGTSPDQSFSDFDVNDDDMLDEDEFGQALDDAGAFDDYDADTSGRVNVQELVEGVYEVLDANDDDSLNESEFEDGSEYFGIGPSS